MENDRDTLVLPFRESVPYFAVLFSIRDVGVIEERIVAFISFRLDGTRTPKRFSVVRCARGNASLTIYPKFAKSPLTSFGKGDIRRPNPLFPFFPICDRYPTGDDGFLARISCVGNRGTSGA